jgi:hypothetical protein
MHTKWIANLHITEKLSAVVDGKEEKLLQLEIYNAC